MPALRQEIIVVYSGKAEIDRARRDLHQHSEATRKETNVLQGNFTKLGATVKTIIGGVAVTAFTALLAALGKASKAAIDFQSDLVDVQKTTGLTSGDLGRLGGNLLDLSGNLGASQRELAQIAAIAGQLGIQSVQDITAFTETVAKLTRVTELSADEAASNVARIANAFDIPIQEAGRIGSVLNELSNTTTALAGNIAGALTRVGTAGSSIGLTADQVAGLSAVLIDSGIVAERAGTSLRNLFVRLQTESDKLAQVIGITRGEFDTLVRNDALEALQTYLEALRALPPNLRAIKIKETFGDENFLAVQSLVEQTDLLTQSLETSRRAFEEGDSLNTEFARSLNSVNAQWEIFTARVAASTTELGQRFLPALERTLRTANNLVQRFDTPAQRLLATLQNIDGVDPEIVAEVRLVVNRQALEEQKKQVEQSIKELEVVTSTSIENSLASRLKTLFSFNPNFFQEVSQSFTTGFITRRETTKIIELTNEELDDIEEKTRKRIVELKDAISKELSDGKGTEGFRLKLQLEEFEGMLDSIEQAKALRAQLDGVNESLSEIENGPQFGPTREDLEAINKFLSENKKLTDDDKPIVSPEDVQRAERVLDAISRAQQLRADLSDDQRKALADVFDAQDEITELLEAQKILGADAIKNQLDSAKARLKAAQAALEKATEFRDAIREAAEEIGKVAAAAVQGPVGKLFEKPKEDIDDILDRTENGAQIISKALRQIPQGTLDELGKDADKLAANIEGATKELNSMSDLIREITGLANVFGDLSEGALEFSRGLSQALSNAAKLSRGIEKIGGIGAAASGIGLFTGLASVFSGIASAINKQGEAQRAQAEAFRRLQDQLRDNARAIAQNTQALLESAQIGADVTAGQIEQAQAFLNDFFSGALRGGQRGRGGALQSDDEIQQAFLAVLNDLQGLGIDDLGIEDFRQQFLDLIAAGTRPEVAAREIAAQIEDNLKGLDAGFGTFSDTVEGSIEALRFFSQFISQDAVDQFNFFLDQISELEDLPASIRDQIERIRGLDLTTQEGQDQLRAIAAEFANSLLSGQAELGGLTPDEARAIFEEILRGAANIGVNGPEDQFAKSVQIGRTITEIQANELIAIQESALFVLQDIRDILGGSGPALFPVLPDNPFQPRDPVVSIGDINAGITEAEVPRLMVMIENEIRVKLRGGR